MRVRRYSIFALCAAVLIVLDQWTKQLAVQALSGGREIRILGDVFTLLYVENRGAAFGILPGARYFFFLITILVTLLILWLLWILPAGKHYTPLFVLCIFVFSGAVGNCIDRLRLHYVVDFFYFRWINFPVFNVADIYVTLSAAAMILLFLFVYREKDFLFLRLPFEKKGETNKRE